jgi:hypothetical protein
MSFRVASNVMAMSNPSALRERLVEYPHGPVYASYSTARELAIHP